MQSERDDELLLHGICSDPDCEEPIAGYVENGGKFCLGHLRALLLEHTVRAIVLDGSTPGYLVRIRIETGE